MYFPNSAISPAGPVRAVGVSPVDTFQLESFISFLFCHIGPVKHVSRHDKLHKFNASKLSDRILLAQAVVNSCANQCRFQTTHANRTDIENILC